MRNLFLLLAACVFCSTGAFAQSAGLGILSTQPQMLVIPDHPAHASQTGMAQEQNILVRSESVSAQGERPLWEVMPPPPFVCLGDVARELRQEHVLAKKAVIVWNN